MSALIGLLVASFAGNVAAAWIIVCQDRRIVDAENELEYVISGERPHTYRRLYSSGSSAR